LKSLFQKKRLAANRSRLTELLNSVTTVYTDVDGTLVGPKACFFLDTDSNYTLEPAKSLILAHESDLDVVMVSGRTRLQLLETARFLGTKNYISELGCQIIYDLGKETITNVGRLPAKNSNKSIFEIIADSGAVEILFRNFPGRLEYHTPWSQWRECTHLFRGFINTDEANRVLADNNLDYLKVVDNGAISRRGTLAALPEVHAYHLLPAQSGKCEAVKRDREIRTIPKEQTVAVGDAASDIVLAAEVGAFFLVKNAVTKDSEVAEMLERFDNAFVTDHEMGLGFAEVINLLVGSGS